MKYFEISLKNRTVGTGGSRVRVAAYPVVKQALQQYSPPFQFNDMQESLEIHCAAGELRDYLVKNYLATVVEAGINLPRNPGMQDMTRVVEQFGTSEYKNKQVRQGCLDEAREILRKRVEEEGYKDAPDTSNVFDRLNAPADIKEMMEPFSMADATDELLKANKGVCLARSHGQVPSLKLLEQCVEKGQMEMLFLEEFTTSEQQLLDDYIDGDEEELPPQLKAKVEILRLHTVDWEPILKKAREKKIKIFAIDSGEARDVGPTFGTEAFGEQRDTMMNAVVFDVMDKALKQYPNKKYMAVVGAAHSMTHRGGVPGVTQMFGIPSMEIDDFGDLRPRTEDVTLRGMPSRDEQIYIDRFIAAESKRRGLRTDRQPDLRVEATKKASELKKSGKLPAFEDQLFLDQLARATKENAAGPIDGDDSADPVALAGAQKSLEALKARLKAEYDKLNKSVVQKLSSYLKKSENAGDPLKLGPQHEQTRIDATKNTLDSLQSALDSLRDIDAKVDGRPTVAPKRADIGEIVRNTVESYQQAQAAITSGDRAALEGLLDAHPELIGIRDPQGRNLLHLAAAHENTEAITAILTKSPGINVDDPDFNGSTALHLACKTRRVDHQNDNPVDAANAMAKQKNAAVKLLDSGANINQQDGNGATPLHLTSLSYNTQVLDELFARNAKLDIKDKRGWTALETSVGATSVEIEKRYYDKGKAQPLPLGDDKKKKSAIDILCEATLCEDPSHQVKVRKAYEDLWANEATRPVVELLARDAASGRNPPGAGTRLIVAKGSTGDSLIQRKQGGVDSELFQAYRGGYDKEAGIIHLCADSGSADFEGVLAHEMTHRATHLVFGKDLYPIDPTDDGAKTKYIQAIEESVKKMHLMEGGKLDGTAKDCVMSRMQKYSLAPGEEGGDHALLQEFIVSVPQLMAQFGKEQVEKLLGSTEPSLCKLYSTFTEQCTRKLDEDPYKSLGDMIDNSGVNVVERDYDKNSEADNWLSPESKRLDLDNVMMSMRTEYAVRHGVPDESRIRKTEMDTPHGKLNPCTIKYDTSMYVIPKDQQADLEKNLAEVRKALEKSLGKDLLDLPVACEDFRELVQKTSEIMHGRKRKDVRDAVQKATDSWLIKAKSKYLDYKIDSGDPLTDAELAEHIALEAESSSRGSKDYEVDREKHAALVNKLKETLAKIPEDKKASLKLQEDLAGTMVGAIAGEKSKGVYVKKKILSRSENKHVSINVNQASRQWLKAIRKHLKLKSDHL